MKKVLFFFAAISMLIACNNGTPVEAECTLLTTSDGLYNLKTADGKKLKVEASSIKFCCNTFFRITLPNGMQQFYVPSTNFLSEPYEDVLYAGGGQFVVTYSYDDDDRKYKDLIDISGNMSIVSADDIFVFFSQKDQRYYYISADMEQRSTFNKQVTEITWKSVRIYEKWKSIPYYDNNGTTHYQIVRDFNCSAQLLEKRLKEGKPSGYETGLITADEPMRTIYR